MNPNISPIDPNVKAALDASFKTITDLEKRVFSLETTLKIVGGIAVALGISGGVFGKLISDANASVTKQISTMTCRSQAPGSARR